MRILMIISFLLVYRFSFAQDQRSTRLKVFLDCRTFCDENYIRSEIKFVDYVLDRVAADVHILITSVQTGSGGNRFQLIFYGQNSFKNITDTLAYNQPPNSTNDEIRIQLAKRIRLGILQFPNKRTTTTSTKKEEGNPARDTTAKSTDSIPAVNTATTTKDKWNYWVYRVGIDGSYSADENYKSNSASLSASANRTTDKLKVNFFLYANNNGSTYKYDNNNVITTYKVNNKTYMAAHYLVISINKHWSVGYETGFSNSTFSNTKSNLEFDPGIEYSIFPYSLVNNKFFTITYSIISKYDKYYDTTIYNKISETLTGHSVKAKLSFNQKWGYINTGLSYSNYFKDWSLRNLQMSIDINVRISGGLSFNIYSNGGIIHDQVYLVKGNATLADVLARKRQLASTYNFYTSVGINYRFGSIFNNFINPRFPSY